MGKTKGHNKYSFSSGRDQKNRKDQIRKQRKEKESRYEW